MIRGQISPNLDELNELHKLYSWIPNESMIRPNEHDLALKREFANYTLTRWNSYRDFVLHYYFKCPFIILNDKYVVFEQIRDEWAFTKSLFRYNLPPNVNHYILWNSFNDMNSTFTNETINGLIEEYLKKIVGSDTFDYAWYLNPKPSVFELWHVQVFWIRT
jgi:hypothetical protein